MDGLEVQAGGGSSVEKVLGVWEKKRFSKSLIKIFYSRLRLAFSENLFLLIYSENNWCKVTRCARIFTSVFPLYSQKCAGKNLSEVVRVLLEE